MAKRESDSNFFGIIKEWQKLLIYCINNFKAEIISFKAEISVILNPSDNEKRNGKRRESNFSVIIGKRGEINKLN
jgi:hypothetical protein